MASIRFAGRCNHYRVTDADAIRWESLIEKSAAEALRELRAGPTRFEPIIVGAAALYNA